MKYWLVAFFLFLLDYGTKAMALERVPPFLAGEFPFGGIGVFEKVGVLSFSLNLVKNSGAAWGIFHGYPGLLFALRVCVIVALGVYLVCQKKGYWGLFLIFAGAVGNAFDYGLYGKVIDFFHFVVFGYSFPVFNVADVCITLGAVLLLFGTKEYARDLKSDD
jgi:signal peptidase II